MIQCDQLIKWVITYFYLPSTSRLQISLRCSSFLLFRSRTISVLTAAFFTGSARWNRTNAICEKSLNKLLLQIYFTDNHHFWRAGNLPHGGTCWTSWEQTWCRSGRWWSRREHSWACWWCPPVSASCWSSPLLTRTSQAQGLGHSELSSETERSNMLLCPKMYRWLPIEPIDLQNCAWRWRWN